MIRYGILSTSSIAPRFISAVRESGTGEIVAVSSRSLQKAEEKAALWQIPKAFGNHMELLKDETVDTVYISAVNSQHYRWAKEALLHGKHVICEKPCTIREEDTRELFRLAKARGLFLMEAQKMLFLPAVLEAKNRIASVALGKIRVAEFTHSFDGSYNAWMYDEAAGGGPLLSSAIYVIELLQFLFDCRVAEIGGYCTNHPGTNVEEQYVLTGRMENGLLFSLKNSTVALMQNGAMLYGEQGWAELPDYWKARKVTFRSRDGEAETLQFPCEHELIYEARHIAECMEHGLLESPVVTGEFSASAIAVLQKVKELWN